MARLTTLLFAMWLGVTVSTVVDLEKRIFGGHECGAHERQYHVKLKTTDIKGTQYLCGGSLISDQWILTAGHCFKPGGTYTAYIGVHPGTPTQVPITDPPVIFKAPLMFFFNGKEHDLMLLKLPKAFEGITPVQLPKCQDPPKIGDTVQVAGHGVMLLGPKNEKLDETSNTLQCADMKIVDCQEFKDKFPVHSQAKKHEHWICYRAPSMDTGGGDSGGGVVYKDRIHAVHVAGDNEQAFAAPAVSMDLCYQPYFDWIEETIKEPPTTCSFFGKC